MSAMCEHREPRGGCLIEGCPNHADARRLRFKRVSEIEPCVARWLYEKRIPIDGIALLAGREGLGKSTIGCDIVAKITRGELDGEYKGTPKSVGFVANEDSWKTVQWPRLKAAGADLTKVFQIDAIDKSIVDSVTLPIDIGRLREDCREHDVVLVIVDPLISAISAKLDAHKDRDVRVALDPLVRFCADEKIAVLALIHINKSGSIDPGDSIMGSRAFTAVPRSVLYCTVDPDDEKGDRYFFGQSKNSSGRKQPTVGYHLIEVTFPSPNPKDEGKMMETSRVIWDEVDGRTIGEIMSSRKTKDDGRTASSTAKQQQILDFLASQPRAQSVKEIADGTRIPISTVYLNLPKMYDKDMVRNVGSLWALPIK